MYKNIYIWFFNDLIQKQNMKARAWILILLFGMISYTGFGITTPDQIQNSEVAMFTDIDVGVNVADFKVVPTYDVGDFTSIEVSDLISHLIFDVEAKEISFDSILESLRQTSYLYSYSERAITNQPYAKIDSIKLKTPHRNPRDGINCI